MGSRTLLITMNMGVIGQMSCNPAIGGVAKGQIVREIDALGGLTGIIADRSAIQFRMLNRSKGPAMWSPRTQNDRMLFAQEWRSAPERIPLLDLWQDSVTSLIIENEVIHGVETSMGICFSSKAVILTAGTFLNGIIHVGEKNFSGGRTGEKASHGITEQLVNLGMRTGRMKTGTPPRIDGRSIDYSKTEEQPGDENPSKFSFTDTKPLILQRSCHITYTNPEAHEILKTGFDKSPMYSGRILGLGPRYCPSIEDKINRFAERERHQLFIEPEGWNTVEVYLNGFSTSLPYEIQQKALKKVPGMENVKMYRPGYAIEYDFFPPEQLNLSLESKLVGGLFLAGQVNGTTGYEEAAAQGLMAGINAHNFCSHKDSIILDRSIAYIGVLINDLVTKGTDEPYRMFTSRAEYRLLLRQDNADFRLSDLGNSLGLLGEEQYDKYKTKLLDFQTVKKAVDELSVTPDEINPYLMFVNGAPISQRVKLSSLISRPEVRLADLLFHVKPLGVSIEHDFPEVIEQLEIHYKYIGYIDREHQVAQKIQKYDSFSITDNIDYASIHSLSSEARQKLKHYRPKTIGHASRISGISPSDISVLLIHLGK
jgi:tRNA uridine 5-carboxymethylaminomethyl modification enzyme